MAADERGGKHSATVYDAVAGRVGYEGLLGEQQPTRFRDTTTTSESAVPPDEVSFRSKDAPARYVEQDPSSADRDLPSRSDLPDADLLKVIHAYAADFYDSLVNNANTRDFRSMDETALLAFGILLEEAAAEVLGRTGDLVLVEPVDRDSDGTPARRQKRDGAWKDVLSTQIKKR